MPINSTIHWQLTSASLNCRNSEASIFVIQP